MAENKKGNNGEVKIVEERGFFAKAKDKLNPKNFKEKHPVASARIEKAAIAVTCIGAGILGDRLIGGRFGKSRDDVIDTDDYTIEDAGVDNFDETSNI